MEIEMEIDSPDSVETSNSDQTTEATQASEGVPTAMSTGSTKGNNGSGSKSKDSPETVNGRKRGRPRLIKSNHTPTDKRRDQIRRAQRAYRLKKESNAEYNKRRVTFLESIFSNIENEFLNFYEDGVQLGLKLDNNELMQLFAFAGVKIGNLFKMIHESDNSDNDQGEKSISKNADDNNNKNQQPRFDFLRPLSTLNSLNQKLPPHQCSNLRSTVINSETTPPPVSVNPMINKPTILSTADKCIKNSSSDITSPGLNNSFPKLSISNNSAINQQFSIAGTTTFDEFFAGQNQNQNQNQNRNQNQNLIPTTNNHSNDNQSSLLGNNDRDKQLSASEIISSKFSNDSLFNHSNFNVIQSSQLTEFLRAKQEQDRLWQKKNNIVKLKQKHAQQEYIRIKQEQLQQQQQFRASPFLIQDHASTNPTSVPSTPSISSSTSASVSQVNINSVPDNPSGKLHTPEELHRTTSELLLSVQSSSTSSSIESSSFSEKLFRRSIIYGLERYQAYDYLILSRQYPDGFNELIAIPKLQFVLKYNLSINGSKWKGKTMDDSLFPGYINALNVEKLLEKNGGVNKFDETVMIPILLEKAVCLGMMPRFEKESVNLAMLLSKKE